MASEKITAIIESVKGLTVLELKELIDTYCEEFGVDRKSTRLNSSHYQQSRMPSSA